MRAAASKSAASKSTARGAKGVPVRPRAKRMPAQARKAVILKEASEFFADHGFSASTRDLADRIGVRQALIYKYFASKEALIDEIFDAIVDERSSSVAVSFSSDSSVPLAHRLVAFYETIGKSRDGAGVRLVCRAAVEDLPVTWRILTVLSKQLYHPVIEELRKLEKLPTISAKAITRGEAELMTQFHAGAMFYALRERLKRLPWPDDGMEHFRLYASCFVEGARVMLREIHAGKWADTIARRDDRPEAH